MIDWVTCRIPVRLPAPIAGGWTIKLGQDGNEISRTPHRMPIEGSFSSNLMIRAPSTTELEIQGNLVKWLQGHNLYGTDDLKALLWTTLQRLEPVLGGNLKAIDIWGPDALNEAIITRVDCTSMLLLDTPGDVLSWINSAYATGTARRRGRPTMDNQGYLVFGHAKGKSFTRWQVVIYAKGQEIAANPLPDFMMEDSEVLNWVNCCLRVETRIGRLDLEKKGLRTLRGWSEETSGTIWSEKVATLSFNDAAKSDTIDLEVLPDHLRGTYAQWKLGADLPKLVKQKKLSKAKFYRHRALIMGLTGVDIAVLAAPSSTATVVPIKRTLEARPSSRPAFADRIDARLRQTGAVVLYSAA